MKHPCNRCPYTRGVFFLTIGRAEELAYHVTETSLECAGFVSLQINEGASCPEGFTVAENAYSDTWDMIESYEIYEDEKSR